jgi:hypothetical protein
MTVCNYIKFTLSHNSGHKVEGKPATILIVSTMNYNGPAVGPLCVIMTYVFIHYTNDSEAESPTVLMIITTTRQEVSDACAVVV